jgi:hypothetical protein
LVMNIMNCSERVRHVGIMWYGYKVHATSDQISDLPLSDTGKGRACPPF